MGGSDLRFGTHCQEERAKGEERAWGGVCRDGGGHSESQIAAAVPED